jgi:hypothetical protein
VGGCAGHGLRGALVEVGETLKERDEDVHVGKRGDDLRVEIGGLGAVAQDQRAGADAGLGGRLAARAADECEEDEKGEGEKRAWTSFHPW